MDYFTYRGQRIAYSEYGSGPRPLILIHGMLLSQRMHEPLARDLAKKGNRVITIDLLGHGLSERPRNMWRYSMSFFGEQVVALMDHLELDEAVIGGSSLGANTTLEVAAAAPERLRGMVLEMPVLDNALLGCALLFTPLTVGLTFGEGFMRLVQSATRAIPHRGMPFWADVALDTLRQDPGPSAAIIQGLLFGRVAPHRGERRTFDAPALVLGHRRDPIHPFSDAGMLSEELPNARLIEANSIIELRLRPERLTREIVDFVSECWRPRTAKLASRRISKAKG